MRRFRSGNRRLCVCVCVCEREREREREEGGSQTGSQRVREREVRRRRVYTLWLEVRGRIPPRRPLGGRRSLYRSYSLYIPISMPLCFWPCLSFSFALPETNASNTADLYHMVGGQRMLFFFVSSSPAFLNF